MDAALCTRFEVEDGLFTGQGTLCYGDQKRVEAEAYLADKGIAGRLRSTRTATPIYRSCSRWTGPSRCTQIPA